MPSHAQDGKEKTVVGGRFAGTQGGGLFRPIFQTPLSAGGQGGAPVTGALDGPGRNDELGGGPRYPNTDTSNDRHDTLIILRYTSGGKLFSIFFSFKPLCSPVLVLRLRH